jgi:hypothetical protein
MDSEAQHVPVADDVSVLLSTSESTDSRAIQIPVLLL